MELAVAFLPALANDWEDRICIVIDVIAASSSIVTILENGAAAVYPVHAVDRARRFAAEHGFLLCGEREGLPLPGFDCGNSVAEFIDMDFSGKGVVLTTSNGTIALEQVARAKGVLVGCARNRTACAEIALNIAVRKDANLGIVCAGYKHDFALDDAVCAGLLVDTMAYMAGGQLELSDSALAAQTLYQGSRDLIREFERSASGRRLKEIGRASDLPLCASIDASKTVPQMTCGENLVIRPFA